MRAKRWMALAAVIVGLVWAGERRPMQAHCDGLDGPVVKAAQRALATGDVGLALVWVQPADEREIRAVFDETVAVRKLGPEAQQLADRHFFETLVRLHRAGEGAPFTGLQPAGRDLGPAIPAADRAIDTGSVSALDQLLTDAVRHGLHERFERLMALKKHDPKDLAAGRAYVAAYVEFIHYAERLHEAAATEAHGHYREAGR